jgi:hypothetical protein
MADFQRMIARHHDVSLRTVRRWCETGKLPGVYRTKGGTWRLIGTCLKQLRQADESFRAASPELRRIYKATLEQQKQWLKELVGVLHVSSALNGGTSALRPQRGDVPIKQLLHPRAIEAVEHPVGLLMIHAETLRGQQIDVRPQSLAKSMQISVATLYRQYEAKEIKRASRADIPRPNGRVGFDKSGPVPTIEFDYDAVRVAA